MGDKFLKRQSCQELRRASVRLATGETREWACRGEEVGLSKICALSPKEVGEVENTLKPDLMAARGKDGADAFWDFDVFSPACAS